MIDIELIKPRLVGANLKRLLKAKRLTKYRVAKDCGITYRTIINWQAEKAMPSDEYAERVGKYLGLIKPGEAEVLELKRQQAELQKKIERLT